MSKYSHWSASERKPRLSPRDKALRIRRHSNFDFAAKRRQEIVLHARHVGVAQTADFSRWLIAWVWHNRKAKDQIWSVMEAAKRMGGKITEAEASAITEEASITRKHLSADNLARFLGVTYVQREALHLTTIGSVNIKRRARKVLRRHRDNRARECKRRASGVQPRAEYEANSLSSTKPWEKLGMSERTWYRKGKPQPQNGRSVATPIFTSSVATPLPPRPAAPEAVAARAYGPHIGTSGASGTEEAVRLAAATCRSICVIAFGTEVIGAGVGVMDFGDEAIARSVAERRPNGPFDRVKSALSLLSLPTP